MAEKRKKIGKHDSLVYVVKGMLEERGFKVETHKTYSRHGADGEMDVYAKKDGYHIYVECKCSNRNKNLKRAHDQFNRAKHYFFGNNKKVFFMYAYWENYQPILQLARRITGNECKALNRQASFTYKRNTTNK